MHSAQAGRRLQARSERLWFRWAGMTGLWPPGRRICPPEVEDWR